MATVTGATAARVQEVEDNSLVDGDIVGNDLVFTTGDGTLINAGRVIPAPVNAWPVGSIFMSTTPTNPATLLLGGTWVRWGKGRMPISLDESNVRFDTPEETGGSESVVLDLTTIPAHNHGGATGIESADHSHSGYTSSNGAHAHSYFTPTAAANTASGSALRSTSSAVADTGSSGTHTHTVATYGASANHTHSIASQGSGGAHENMPPFIAVYMWKRTA